MHVVSYDSKHFTSLKSPWSHSIWFNDVKYAFFRRISFAILILYYKSKRINVLARRSIFLAIAMNRMITNNASIALCVYKYVFYLKGKYDIQCTVSTASFCVYLTVHVHRMQKHEYTTHFITVLSVIERMLVCDFVKCVSFTIFFVDWFRWTTSKCAISSCTTSSAAIVICMGKSIAWSTTGWK